MRWVRTRSPEIVLTFDDGPRPGSTDEVLDVLREHRATATFFVLGNRAAGNPELIRRIVREGHELALHGPDHRALPYPRGPQP